MAQGNLIVGGFGASGADGSQVTVNIPSTGRIPNGAMVEVPAPSDFETSDRLILNLHNPDFTTSSRLAELINSELGSGTATSLDSVSIEVRAPLDTNQRTSFIAHIQDLEVEPGSPAARVIVNSRTGTVVVSSNVRVTAAAVSHGSLVVRIDEQFGVSQPLAPFSDAGQTVVIPNSEVTVEQEDSSMFLFEPGTSLEDIVQTVNRVGAAPGDLVAILEALKQAGALRAELVVI
jgi:flagellar P-ring protein precursor FlgI